MPQISEVKIIIGKDAFGRELTATRYLYNGKPMWWLRSAPVNQRDDGEGMRSLTDENLRDLVKALDLVK